MLDEALLDHATERTVRHRPAPSIWWRCATCAARIARRDAALSFDGSHRHAFTNPHGLRFEIALFGEAPGGADEGEPTEYFSWFVGYTWTILLCARCRMHLGWRFRCTGPPAPAEPPGFAGLLLERLKLDS